MAAKLAAAAIGDLDPAATGLIDPDAHRTGRSRSPTGGADNGHGAD
jgi:hypothetical protein